MTLNREASYRGTAAITRRDVSSSSWAEDPINVRAFTISRGVSTSTATDGSALTLAVERPVPPAVFSKGRQLKLINYDTQSNMQSLHAVCFSRRR